MENNYEVVNQIGEVVIPDIMDGEEIALAVVKYVDENKYGVELDEDLSTCSYDDFMGTIGDNFISMEYPEIEKIGNCRFDTEEEALNLAKKIMKILVFC